jgi:hypothetical protein
LGKCFENGFAVLAFPCQLKPAVPCEVFYGVLKGILLAARQAGLVFRRPGF